jgi:hypothetical protein
MSSDLVGLISSGFWCGWKIRNFSRIGFLSPGPGILKSLRIVGKVAVTFSLGWLARFETVL